MNPHTNLREILTLQFEMSLEILCSVDERKFKFFPLYFYILTIKLYLKWVGNEFKYSKERRWNIESRFKVI